jgi:response regulator RpfG family c-di-GMP phosphodiesterase
MSENFLTFAPDHIEENDGVLKPWKVVIADDDEEIHKITKLALNDYRYLNQPIEFIDSYSKSETLNILRSHNDIALVLLDVVMDEPNSGLQIVKFIRETLREPMTRIILRTGEPGSAPEKEVVSKFDINDYKEKTELTATKLFTSVHTSIKNYCDIRTISASKQGFTKIISDAADLYQIKEYSAFVETAIAQFVNLMQANPDVVLLKSDGELNAAAFCLDHVKANIKSIAGTGRFSRLPQDHAESLLTAAQMETVLTASTQKKTIVERGSIACVFESEVLGTFVLFFEGLGILKNFDFSIVDVFLSHICRAMENSSLQRELNDTQIEIINKMGEVVEFRSAETPVHVSRVSQITKILATSMGWHEADVNKISLAAVLHDLGKISVKDSILAKPGKLDADEFKEITRHTVEGHALLKDSSHAVMSLAAKIALDHHEKWDGTGYPNGKHGLEIFPPARIVALADVYDALGSERAYKAKWNRQDAFHHIVTNKSIHFDPLVVEHFILKENEINLLFDQDTTNWRSLEWSRTGIKLNVDSDYS